MEKGKLNKKYALVVAIILVLASVSIITAHAQGLSVSIGPLPPYTIDLGQSELFIATASGGSSPYSY
jgi:hypothetical protein